MNQNCADDTIEEKNSSNIQEQISQEILADSETILTQKAEVDSEIVQELTLLLRAAANIDSQGEAQTKIVVDPKGQFTVIKDAHGNKMVV